MISRIEIIATTFLVTIVGCVCYTVYVAYHVPESNSIAIPFIFVGLAALLLCAESVLFAIIFFRHFKEVFPLLAVTFLSTAIVPSYFAYQWFDNRPVKIQPAGPLPVAMAEYQKDQASVINDYKTRDVDSSGLTIYQAKVVSVGIDTIIYSHDLKYFFAIIIVEGMRSDTQHVFCAEYRVARKEGLNWQLSTPKGNIWATCFDSVPQLKSELRQYYAKRYSINGSSRKKEIWDDQYIFDFKDSITDKR